MHVKLVCCYLFKSCFTVLIVFILLRLSLSKCPYLSNIFWDNFLCFSLNVYAVHVHIFLSFELHIIGSMSLLLTTMYTLIPPLSSFLLFLIIKVEHLKWHITNGSKHYWVDVIAINNNVYLNSALIIVSSLFNYYGRTSQMGPNTQ